jgi:hypothetical protein
MIGGLTREWPILCLDPELIARISPALKLTSRPWVQCIVIQALASSTIAATGFRTRTGNQNSAWLSIRRKDSAGKHCRAGSGRVASIQTYSRSPSFLLLTGGWFYSRTVGQGFRSGDTLKRLGQRLFVRPIRRLKPTAIHGVALRATAANTLRAGWRRVKLCDSLWRDVRQVSQSFISARISPSDNTSLCNTSIDKAP